MHIKFGFELTKNSAFKSPYLSHWLDLIYNGLNFLVQIVQFFTLTLSCQTEQMKNEKLDRNALLLAAGLGEPELICKFD